MEPSTPPVEKTKLPLWAKLLIISFSSIVVLTCIAIVGFFIYATNLMATPLKLSNQFVNALQANDASTAYALTSSEFKFITKQDTLTSIFETVSPELQGNETVSDKQYRIYNGISSATIVYSVPTNTGTNYIKIVVREKNNKWEVLSMLTSKKELTADAN